MERIKRRKREKERRDLRKRKTRRWRIWKEGQIVCVTNNSSLGSQLWLHRFWVDRLCRESSSCKAHHALRQPQVVLHHAAGDPSEPTQLHIWCMLDFATMCQVERWGEEDASAKGRKLRLSGSAAGRPRQQGKPGQPEGCWTSWRKRLDCSLSFFKI